MINKGYFQFEAFGLVVSSDINFPELHKKNDRTLNIDITLSINKELAYHYSGRPFDFVMKNNIVTLLVPKVGVFQMKDGKEILISPYKDANEDIIRLYILGSCFGTLLLQRGILPLHGSAIAVDGKAYAIVGESGAGKSTLASAFMEKGYQLLSDDVIALSFSGVDDNPHVIPSYPQQKLWQQSLEEFGIDYNSLRPIYGREDKYCIPVNDKYCSIPMQLAGIFELKKTDAGSVSIHPIIGLEQLRILFEHTYRQFLIPKMNLTEWHFKQSTLLASNLPLYKISRPITGFSAYQIVEQILNTIHKNSHKNYRNIAIG
ncbi:aldolase [Bacillus sp. PS06]|uniref:aldolase n=1 Tax=Bacillus sp. PS06 TaxID=2764176 RepID=UPI0017845491|nr:aldolase [Bacillus sp. PS06]MBD8071108.1 aldolase [Bacillus sp. PS06]